MTSTPSVVVEAEALVRELADSLLAVRPGECLGCYVWRQLGPAPCNSTLRHAMRYRDAVAPRATALRERLFRVGGSCDCCIFTNGYRPREEFWTPARWTEDGEYLDAVEPDELPPCTGVRRGSVRFCGHWVRVWRGFR